MLNGNLVTTLVVITLLLVILVLVGHPVEVK